MRYILPDGREIGDDVPFKIGEGEAAIQYPSNWIMTSTAQERAALGIVDYTPPPPEPPPAAEGQPVEIG